jgi:hypothetical protein
VDGQMEELLCHATLEAPHNTHTTKLKNCPMTTCRVAVGHSTWSMASSPAKMTRIGFFRSRGEAASNCGKGARVSEQAALLASFEWYGPHQEGRRRGLLGVHSPGQGHLG